MCDLWTNNWKVNKEWFAEAIMIVVLSLGGFCLFLTTGTPKRTFKIYMLTWEYK